MERIVQKHTLRTKTGVHNIAEIKNKHIGGYVSEIINMFPNQGFNVGALDKIYLLGGCASLVSPYFTEQYNNIKIEVEKDPQFTNSKLFWEIAKRNFSK
jgi:hypothetical protein